MAGVSSAMQPPGKGQAILWLPPRTFEGIPSNGPEGSWSRGGGWGGDLATLARQVLLTA